MINKESIILFKKWVCEGKIFLDICSNTFMLEDNISQGESEFYAVAPELTGLFIPLEFEEKKRYSFCYGQFAMNQAKPRQFEPIPAKLFKVIKCSHFSLEHHKSNPLSAINFANFHFGEGFEDGMSFLSDSISNAKTLNQIGNINAEYTLIAAILLNVADVTLVKIESIEMLFGIHVRKIIEVLLDIHSCDDANTEALLKKLEETTEDVKRVQLVILVSKLKYASTLDEKEKYSHLLLSDQQAKVCQNASSSLYHLYIVERSKLA